MITRQQYLDSDAPGKHEAYYGELVEAAGGAAAFRHRLPCSVERIREALAKGDEHLNDIVPLKRWDMAALPVPAGAAKAMKERGDYVTLSGAVCILKEAARQLALADD